MGRPAVTRIVLAFMPLIETGFGQLYPSTAVLAAYLERQGFRTVQMDLNAPFFGHIVSDEELTASGGSCRCRSP